MNLVYQNSTSTTYGVSNFPAISSAWHGSTNASYLSRTPQASTPTQSSIAVQQHDDQGTLPIKICLFNLWSNHEHCEVSADNQLASYTGDYAVGAAQKEHNLLIGSSAEDVGYLDPSEYLSPL